MAGLCSDSVLTGQEGSIQFKPPGSTVCVRDFEPFGTGTDATRIALPCESDFRVGDVVVFVEEDGGVLDTALVRSAAPRVVAGEILTLGDFVSSSDGTAGTYSGVALTGGNGTGATANVVVGAGGNVTSATLVAGGSGYSAGDLLSAAPTDIGDTASFSIEVAAVSTIGPGLTGYYVVGTGEEGGHPFIQVALNEGGTAIAMNGDGGTGSADSPLPAHINIQLADWYAVCGVREFSLEISRDELDVTTLPCVTSGTESAGCDKLAAFRSTQAGYANATGSMTVYFTCDQNNISNRLLGSSLLRDQSGAKVKLYVCTQVSNGVIDDDASLYVEAEINITGMSFSVNPDDATTAELSFSVKKMTSAFGLSN